MGEEKCQQLQQLYQHAASIPAESLTETLNSKAIKNFADNFEYIDHEPLAAASVGQVHRAL